MVPSLLSLVLLTLPQGEVPRGEPRVVGVDENGWPILGGGVRQVESLRNPRSDFDTDPSARPFEQVAPIPVRSAEPGGKRAPRVGQPVDLEDLGGVVAWCRATVFDHRGAEVGAREFTHEADLAHPRRDRLLLPGRKVYGRDGPSVFAQLHRLPMPSYELEARDELEILGLLLRVPWAFADAAEFEVVEVAPVSAGGRELVRIALERPAARGESREKVVDTFELRCTPDRMEPVELRYRLAGGRPCTVRFEDYRRLGGVRIPMRRSLLDTDGGVAMVLEILRIDPRQSLPQSQFRPVR